MRVFSVAAILSLCLCSFDAETVFARTWTVDNGETLEGEYVRLEAETLILQVDGVETAYPLNRFSEADREFVREQRKPEPGQLSVEEPSGEVRVWTDIVGNQVRGQFVELFAGKVIIRDQNDFDTELELINLVPEAKAYVNILQTKKKQANGTPKVGVIPTKTVAPLPPENSTTEALPETSTEPATVPTAPEMPELQAGQATYGRRDRSRRTESTPGATTPAATPAQVSGGISAGMIVGGVILIGFVVFLLRRPESS